MKVMESHQFDPKQLTGRNRRLLYEWRQLEKGLDGHRDITLQVKRRNSEGLPVSYLVDYHLRSICGVEHVAELNESGVENKPLFATGFKMIIDLPVNYPCVDAPPSLYFLTTDTTGEPLIRGIPTSATLGILPGESVSIWPTPILISCGELNGWRLICAMIPTMR